MGSAKSRLSKHPDRVSHTQDSNEAPKGEQKHHVGATTPRGNHLPPIVHATLTKEQIGSGRLIVIGDIHGCTLELEDLLKKVAYKHGEDLIISVGDLVGKGPHSRQVLKQALRLGMLTVRGNWEENALAAYRTSGGQPSDGKWGWMRECEQAELDYMQSTPFSLSIPSHGCVVVHAGLVPGVPLPEQQLFDLIEMRHVDLINPPASDANSAEPQKWKALPKFPREAGKPWATIWPGPQHIIFGHHARRRLQSCSYASGIDTGCCLGDQLTALVLPSLIELESRNWQPNPEGVTREDLGAKIISIQARQQYRADDKD